MKTLAVLLTAMFAAAASLPQAFTAPLADGPAGFTASVVAISDGDTLTVVDDAKQQTKIRLHGIDAPEAKQPFGSKAKDALSAKIFGKSVRIVRRDVDRYGRTVAEVFIGDRLINRELVAEGFAWHYVKYAPNDAELAAAEKAARDAKRGLWLDAAPVAPWEFRKPAAKSDGGSQSAKPRELAVYVDAAGKITVGGRAVTVEEFPEMIRGERDTIDFDRVIVTGDENCPFKYVA